MVLHRSEPCGNRRCRFECERMRQVTRSFEESYPNITHWVTSQGWIELGPDHYSSSLVRALDEGGMVWEGTANYASLDEVLDALETALVCIDSAGAPTASEPWPSQEYSILTMSRSSLVNVRITPRVYDGLHKMEGRGRWFRNRQPHGWWSCLWLIWLIHR